MKIGALHVILFPFSILTWNAQLCVSSYVDSSQGSYNVDERRTRRLSPEESAREYALSEMHKHKEAKDRLNLITQLEHSIADSSQYVQEIQKNNDIGASSPESRVNIDTLLEIQNDTILKTSDDATLTENIFACTRRLARSEGLLQSMMKVEAIHLESENRARRLSDEYAMRLQHVEEQLMRQNNNIKRILNAVVEKENLDLIRSIESFIPLADFVSYKIPVISNESEPSKSNPQSLKSAPFLLLAIFLLALVVNCKFLTYISVFNYVSKLLGLSKLTEFSSECFKV